MRNSGPKAGKNPFQRRTRCRERPKTETERVKKAEEATRALKKKKVEATRVRRKKEQKVARAIMKKNMSDSKFFQRDKVQTLRAELTATNATGKKKVIKQKATALKKIVANMTVF